MYNLKVPAGQAVDNGTSRVDVHVGATADKDAATTDKEECRKAMREVNQDGPRAIRASVYNPYGSFGKPDPLNASLGFELAFKHDMDWSDDETDVPGAARAPAVGATCAEGFVSPLLAALVAGKYKPCLWSAVAGLREEEAERAAAAQVLPCIAFCAPLGLV